MVLTQWETLCGLFFAFFEKIVVPILTSGGYVGLSLSVLLAQHNQVMAVDIVQAKVDMINNHKSPIQDDYIEKYLAEKELNLTATLDAKAACGGTGYVKATAPDGKKLRQEIPGGRALCLPGWTSQRTVPVLWGIPHRTIFRPEHPVAESAAEPHFHAG